MARMSQGVFQSLGGDIISSVDIVPEPELIASQLLEVAHNFENIILPLQAAKRIARQDIQAHFDQEIDPDGNQWIALDVDYARSKEAQGYPEDILHRTGELESAATSDAAFSIIGDALFFNWDALPTSEDGEQNLGALHQTGTSEGPFIRPYEVDGKTVAPKKQYTGKGRGGNLPARPFVGLSEEAEIEVWTAFDVWFDESIQVAINPRTGVVQERLASGRFGSKIV